MQFWQTRLYSKLLWAAVHKDFTCQPVFLSQSNFFQFSSPREFSWYKFNFPVTQTWFKAWAHWRKGKFYMCWSAKIATLSDWTYHKICQKYILGLSGEQRLRNATADKAIQCESGRRVWLQPWWQQLHSGTCSWSWLAADTSSLDCLWDINTCSKCCLSALDSPKVSCVHHQCQNASGSMGLQCCLEETFTEWYGWLSRGGGEANRLLLPLASVIISTTPYNPFTLSIKSTLKSLHHDAAFLQAILQCKNKKKSNRNVQQSALIMK